MSFLYFLGWTNSFLHLLNFSFEISFDPCRMYIAIEVNPISLYINHLFFSKSPSSSSIPSFLLYCALLANLTPSLGASKAMKSAVSKSEDVLRSEDVSKALNSIKRTIRLSSAASSPHFLVLGANTGSLYFFDRPSLRFLQLAVFEDLQEPISHVSFSPDEKMLAFATAHPHRHIYITQVPIKARRRKVR